MTQINELGLPTSFPFRQYREVRAYLLSLDPEVRVAAERWLARNDIYYLLRYLLGRADVENEWLYERCQEYQQEPNGCLDLWSREHYKSTIITFTGSIQDILSSHGNDPLPKWGGREVTIGIFSHTRPNAKKFLRQIKRELEDNDYLKALFPDVLYKTPSREAKTWSEDTGLHVKRRNNPREATVEAWGLVDGQPVGSHFLIQIFDDVVTKESVTNSEMIKKTTDALELAYDLIQTQGGLRRMIGTRYFMVDTYHTVLARKTFKPRIHPATKDGSFEGEPVFWDDETWKDKLRAKTRYNAACQYLQNPIADKTMGFQRQYVKYFDNVSGAGMNKILLCDPANEKKKKSDYTAMVVWGLAPDGNLYLLDLIRDRLSLAERTDAFFALHDKWKPYFSGWEKYGKDADIEHIKDIQERRNYRFDIVPLGGTMSKNDRIHRLTAWFEQGRVYLPRHLFVRNWEGAMIDLVEAFLTQEFDVFPVGEHDDMLDVMSRIDDEEVIKRWPKLLDKQVEKYKKSQYGSRRGETSFMSL